MTCRYCLEPLRTIGRALEFEHTGGMPALVACLESPRRSYCYVADRPGR